MGFHELQYRKLLSELKFKNEELEIIEESMYEIHTEFEEYYNDFLGRNNLTKAELEQAKTPEFEQFKKERVPPLLETDETGIVALQQDTEEDKEAKVVFSKLYKQIVKKCHPDRLSQDDMEYFNKIGLDNQP